MTTNLLLGGLFGVLVGLGACLWIEDVARLLRPVLWRWSARRNETRYRGPVRVAVLESSQDKQFKAAWQAGKMLVWPDNTTTRTPYEALWKYNELAQRLQFNEKTGEWETFNVEVPIKVAP